MLFSSHEFILFFLPTVIVIYYLLTSKNKNTISKVWLLIASLFFYGYFNWSYLPIILVSIFVNFALYSYMKDYRKKSILILGLIFNIGVLFYFKYFNFFIDNINYIFKLGYTTKQLILPLGISFFTFQQVSFIVDTYKGKVPNYNMLDYALFVTFFPQLIAGPIVLHSEIVPQFQDENKRKFNFDNIAAGVFSFSRGLAKKVIIADMLSQCVAIGYADVSALNSGSAIFVMLCYTLQIYYDFSGYSDMAIGLGKFLNIDIPMNFNSPYKAINILDFWKRWHITLTRFFTQYVYIPLGGNKKPKRVYINIFIIYFLSGLWHGANYTFIVWGLLHAIASILTRIYKNKIEKIPHFISWLLTFAFINLTWIFFRANSVVEAIEFIDVIFSFNGLAVTPTLLSSIVMSELTMFFTLINLTQLTYYAAYIMVITYAFSCFVMKNTSEKLLGSYVTWNSLWISIFITVLSLVSMSGVSEFLYWNF